MNSDHLLPRTVFSCTESSLCRKCPANSDHLSTKTMFICTRGWSFWRGFTIHVVQCCKQLLGILQAQHNGALERKPYQSRSRNKKLKSLMKAAALMHDFTVLPRFFFTCFFFFVHSQALLPLVNRPLIDYTLEFLLSSGIEDIIVLCRTHADQIRQHIDSLKYVLSPVWLREVVGNCVPLFLFFFLFFPPSTKRDCTACAHACMCSLKCGQLVHHWCMGKAKPVT